MVRAALALRRGGVAVFPTDTVTGLGCAARSRSGIAAIFSLKRREPEKSLVLFAADIGEVERMTGRLPARVRRLLGMVWPGAFTAVLKVKRGQGRGRPLVPGLVRAGTVAVRIPAHPVPRALVRLAGGPLATTSANLSGALPLRDAGQARRLWGKRVAVVPGLSGSVPSTVAALAAWPPRVLREGAISRALLAELAAAAGKMP